MSNSFVRLSFAASWYLTDCPCTTNPFQYFLLQMWLTKTKQSATLQLCNIATLFDGRPQLLRDDPTYCILTEKLRPKLRKPVNRRLFPCSDHHASFSSDQQFHKFQAMLIAHIWFFVISSFSHLAMALKLPVRKAELPHASSTLKSSNSILPIIFLSYQDSSVNWSLINTLTLNLRAHRAFSRCFT